VLKVKGFGYGLLAAVFSCSFLLAKEENKLEKSILVETNWKSEIAEIDKEIDKLQNQRNLYLAKATRLQNQGDRLQFENNNLIDARRAWQQAQIHREIATRIQEEIDQLEARKQKILDGQGMSRKPDGKASR
jgi:hypothetical protein